MKTSAAKEGGTQAKRRQARRKPVARRSADAAKVPAAYDIAAEKPKCKGRKMPSREVIAYMAGGELQLVLDVKTFVSEPDERPWIGGTSRPPKYVRCVAVSRGDAWEAWKADVVRKMLLNSPATKKNEQWDLLPNKGTMFDPDLHDAVWQGDDETTLTERCKAFAASVHYECRKRESHAREIIRDFDAPPDNRSDAAQEMHWRLEQLRKAADRLDLCATFHAELGSGIDAGIALRQGLRIGMWLAEIDAIVSFAPYAATAAAQGVSSRQESAFWRWVQSSPIFDGKNDKEASTLLHGMQDTELSGKKMRIKGGRLMLGEKRLMKESSFRSKYRKLRPVRSSETGGK